MKLFHGSPNLFDSFDIGLGGRGEHASNGALGVWVSDEIDIPRRFGDYVYHIEIDNPKEKVIPVRTLIEWHNEAGDLVDDEAEFSFYDQIRLSALAEGYDMISVIEKDGSMPTRVVLNPSRIRILDIEGPSPEP